MTVALWEQHETEGKQQTPHAPMLGDDRERLYGLQLRVQELEGALRERDEALARERDRSNRARKKIKQLLAKLFERDEALAETRHALQHLLLAGGAGGSHSSGAHAGRARGKEVVQDCADGALATAAPIASVAPVAPAARRSSAPERLLQAGCTTAAQASMGSAFAGVVPEAEQAVPSGASSYDAAAAARERAQIVAQLEGHLTQMRTNFENSEKEARELESRVRAKEAEWNSNSKGGRPPEVVRAHWQALLMLRQQAQEKRGFAMDLCQKTRRLEEQISMQRSLILDGAFCSGGAEAGQESEGSGVDDVQRQKALRAFLDAAGSAGEALRARPALRAALKARPPKLTGEAVQQCAPEERTQALSLFAAWAAVAGDSPCALHVSDLLLGCTDAGELRAALQTCGAQLEEWQMTRCPAENESAMRALCAGLATQPLRRLSLGYNALGAAGALALANVAGAWSSSLEYLGLEMNGLGDSGCEEVVRALERGALPQLRHLELGWNELSASCAPTLASLLTGPDEEVARAEVEEQGPPVPRLQKLGLAGNSMSSGGAMALALAALTSPDRQLELDLSMNHVGSGPLHVLTEWIEACDCPCLGVSLGLEWNVVDDPDAVERLATACGEFAMRGQEAVADGDPRRPLVRLANNELVDLDANRICADSRGLVVL